MNDKQSEFLIGRITYFDPDHEGEHLCANNHLLLLLVPRQKTGNSAAGRNVQDREFSRG